MFTLLNAVRSNPIDTPDTGTFADGAFQMSRIELHSMAKQERTSNAHARDYGGDRTVRPALIGYA
ncbi:hypothetical protein [Rhizobium sp. RU36D]|uniref:hypothetical protein n=1 Tax=Rhizobium sp. RU36D TaxID=1907415 RepID=UPI0009D7A2F4|nr:hypothetical protein [Rhizobium sp. RU36D]SMC43142.1 hypothetical protein SAMN05880593_101282 [Rhizobium sp. RU36D]